MRPSCIFVLSAFYLFFAPCAPLAAQNEDPLLYHQTILKEQKLVMDAVLNYNVASVHEENYDKLEEMRNATLQTLRTGIQNLENITTIKKDGNLKGEMTNSIRLILKSFETDYAALDSLSRISKSSFEALERYYRGLDQVDKKIETAQARMLSAQEKFAQLHKIKIMDNPENDGREALIEQIKSTERYSRKIFLAYFRVAKPCEIFFNAYQEKNWKMLEPARQKLITSIQPSLNDLKILGDYADPTQPNAKKDDKTRLKTEQLIKAYKKFGESGMMDIAKVMGKTDVHVTAEEQEKMVKAFNEYNEKLMPLINETLQEINEFYKRHIPNEGVQVGKTKRI